MDIYDMLQDARFAKSIRAVKTNLLQHGHHQWRSRAKLERRVRELEDGIGLLALVTRALAEVCIEKGVLSHADLMRNLTRLDLADGRQDRRLNPRLALPEKGAARKPAKRAARRKKTTRR